METLMAATPSQLVLLNERQAAHQLGLKVTTLRRWRWSGKPPNFVKIGAAVRYDPADLQIFIDAGRRSSTSDQGSWIQLHKAR
jgi:hypothetical protein